jgi:membrane dipeptidase
LHRGYSETDIHKILGANVLRAFRQAGEVAKRLRATTPPEVDEIKLQKRGG